MKVKKLFSSGVFQKRKYPFFLIPLFFVLLLLSSAAYSSSAIPPEKLTDGQKAFVTDNPGLQVEWNANEGIPYSIKGLSRAIQGDRVKAIINYLNEVKTVFKMTEAASEMTFKKVDKDELGFEHYRLQQVYRGIRVANGEIIVQVNDRNQITQINGQYYPEISIPLNTSLTGYDAMSKVVKDFEGKPNFRVEKEPELVIYPQGLSNYRLAYHFILYYDDQAGDVGRWVFYVDALTGEIINSYNDIKYFKAIQEIPTNDKNSYPKAYLPPTLKKILPNNFSIQSIAPPTSNGSPYNITGSILTGEGGNNTTVQGWYESTNNSYYLYSYNLGWYIKNASTSTSYSDANTYAYRAASPDWGTTDRTEMSAAQNMKIVQDYYKTIHARNSFDNASTPARVNVHYGTNYVNAYWNGTDITIGDGDGTTANSLAVLDVMGHEFSHAWTEHTSNLTYQGESGALNESFSDIMGANIEFYAQADARSNYPGKTAGKADWLIGEDCWLASTALRDMHNPGSTTTLAYGSQQPSRYHGQYWVDKPPSQSTDNGGVHTNGGPQNFFYYLLSDGGAGSNDGLSYSVTGIGVNNARLVSYRTNSYKLTASSGYAATRVAWISAAADLNAAWVNNVKAAWDAVGIIDVPATVTESFEGSSLPSGWTTGGDASWSIVTDSAKHGSKSLKSGTIQNYQSTWVQKAITPSSAGNVSFFVTISSEMGYDKLEFYVDGVKKTTWSGEVPWTSYVTYLAAGSHTLKWQYVKDSSVSSGSDAAWIDALTYPDSGSSCTYAISPTSANIIAGGGTGTVNVTTQSGCSWTAVSNNNWITVTSGSSGSATGTVGYSVAANTTSQRSGTITITGQAFTVTQDAGSGQSGGIGAAVDNAGLTWTTTGSATWYGETSVSYYGGSAAQSGAIGNSQTTSVQTMVTGPAQLSFYWKASSEANYDFLRFYIDGSLQTSISGNVDWSQKTYALSSGSHTLKWEYSKDGSVSSGSDAGWIDKVVVGQQDIYTLTVSTPGTGSGTVTSSPSGISCGSTCSATYTSGTMVTLMAAASSNSSFAGWSGGGCSGTGTCIVAMNSSQTVTATFTPAANIANAVDNTSLTWTTGGNANWAYQTITSYYAGDAARSGAIDNSQSTWVQTTITGPGQVSFYWMVSSEVNFDFLKFYINGVLQKSISGEVNWQRETFTLSSGTNTLKWMYIKDPTSAVGQDAGWLDRVVFCAQGLCSASPVNISTNSVGSRNTIKITDLSGSLPAGGGAITVTAWDTYGRMLVESESAAPLRLYSNRTTTIAGSDLMARFPADEPSTYEVSIYSPALIITNVKSSADGTLNIPMVYTRGVVNYHYASNSIGSRNTLKITDMTGTIPAGGADIIVKAWDASGNALPEASSAVPLKIYSHRTTFITGSEIAARFPVGSPLTYDFTIGSSKVVVTNVKSSADGSINIPTVYTNGVTNFVSNSTGLRNTLKISDLSGSLPTDGGVVTVSAWNADGSVIPQSGAAAPLKLYSHGTITVTGSELAARFPAGSPMTYEFSIGSSKAVVTNVKSSSDGIINIPTVYSVGMTNFATNYVSPRNTIKITDMSGSVPARAYIRVTAWDATGNAIPQSGTTSALKLNNHGTTTISGSDLERLFSSGSPSMYEFSIDSSKVVITNSMSSSDGTISVPSVYSSGVDGGI